VNQQRYYEPLKKSGYNNFKINEILKINDSTFLNNYLLNHELFSLGENSTKVLSHIYKILKK
jgi:hypothetical protein